MNHGPVKLAADAGGVPELPGDGIVAALTLAKPATRGRLLVSRHFDSLEALERIAGLSATVGADESAMTAAPTSPSGTRIAGQNRLREDPFLRNLETAVLPAILASFAIALAD